MASSYSTSLGIEKMATGDQSGAWGTTSNYNWDIIDRISAYGTVALSDAATATLTVREASPESGTENLQNGMYRVIKFTGSLSQNCTITIAPNTTKVFFILENATTDAGSSGPYSLIFSQGSGANVTVQNSKNVIVYCDGAGGGAVVSDALANLQIGTLESTGAAAIDGALTVGGATAFGGNTLTNFSEVANAATNTGTAQTVPSNTNVVRYTLNGNATITLPASQPAGSAAVKTIVLYFKQDGTGSRTMALAAPAGETLSYNNSSALPTVNATAAKVTIYTCMKFDSDTVWYVSQSYIDD
jgi:hypothetical protein|tara:strand:+ start:939 stop:1841 length:903 start_codon:yes stop_codon:yes gene_type:complete